MGTETFFFVAQGSPMTKNQASVKNLINLGIRSRTRKYYHGILFSRKKCLQKRYSFAPPLTMHWLVKLGSMIMFFGKVVARVKLL